jgi:folate-binding protein YgfZ
MQLRVQPDRACRWTAWLCSWGWTPTWREVCQNDPRFAPRNIRNLLPVEPIQPLMQNSEQALTSGKWGSIRVTGADRVAFLQGQLTQDIAKLTTDKALLAGWCSPKGRLLCLAWLCDWQESIWLVMPAELIDQVTRRLKMFVLRAAVEITPDALPVSPITRSNAPFKANFDSNNNLVNYCLYDDKYAAIFPGLMPEMALLIGAADTADAAINETAWRTAAIASGLPSVSQATSEEFVPQMLNLDLLDGISFTKGCYVGQEIAARTQNLGRIKRRMYGFSYSGPLTVAPGQPVVVDGKTVGQVVDATSSADSTRLLAVIRIEHLNNEMFVAADSTAPLERRELAYPVPENVDGNPA